MSMPEPLRTRSLMSPYALIYLYRRRLRIHAAQELFAGLGIAIAVALVLAATVAQRSIAGSSGEVVRTLVGPASLQLRARVGYGFRENLLVQVEHLPGVRLAAPLLEQTASVRAGGRSVTIDLAGADTSLAVLDGLGETLPLGALKQNTIGLSAASASALGIASARAGAHRTRTVSLLIRGRRSVLPVSAVLGQEAAGALAGALVGVMPLASMQRLTGLQGRVTRIFIQTAPGAQDRVAGELRALAGPAGLSVAPADQDVTLLHQALGPSRLASGLFAAIGALLGLLFAFNAMLLTVPERRQTIADLRLAGTRRLAIVQMVLFQAVCLGALASLAGLLAGWALSVGVFHQSSAYLAEAFTLGSSTVIGWRELVGAFAGGVLATCLASTVVLSDLRRGRARDAVYQQREGVVGDTLGHNAQRRLFAGALALLIAAGALYALAPAAAIVATALLALATVLAAPLAFAGVLALARRVSERSERLIALPVALASLRTTTLRSLALAATGAVALFGGVALGGSRENLTHGIDRFAHSYVAGAQVWVTNPDDNQAVEEISPGGVRARIARVGSVAGVQAFHGGFAQLGERRVWLIARPGAAIEQVLESEIQHGDAHTALARLRAGGWIAVSQKIAAEHHTGVGGALTLPTPAGAVRLRIAATTTNLAWPPGVVFISPADYARWWGNPAPTAFGVTLRAGASTAGAVAAIARALGPASGLEVASATARQTSIDALTSEGLGQLKEIATLLLVAAICAMAAALASSLWQRRAWLAGLRLAGAQPARLRRILALEGALMLGAGCLTGAIAGIYGQVVIDGYLRDVTGFPLSSAVGGWRPLEIFVLVLGLALAIMALPGWLASRISPGLALESE